MIKGMTGFGSSQITIGGIRIIVEIKSLNHRYCDIINYLPTGFTSIENKIRQLIQKHITRGRVTTSIKIIQKPLYDISLNKDAVRTHLKYARQLGKEFKIINNLSVTDIIKLPGVIETKETFITPEKIWTNLEKGITRALYSVIKMRNSEGRSLYSDISDQLKKMFVEAKKIQTRAKLLLAEKKKILTPEEYKSFQKSNDINEELSRLSHFISEMKILLKSKTAVGKKMDFIAQEMQRETNTIGSKLQDKAVSSGVIALKSKIEKIREQAQNIE